MIECDRCGRDYSNKLMRTPKYVVKETFDLGCQVVEDPLYLCPMCSRGLEKFMNMECEVDASDD